MMIDFSIPLVRFLASSNFDAGYTFGWLLMGSLGVFVLTYAYLIWQRKTSLKWVKAAARAKKQAWKKLKVPLSRHTWMEDVATGGQPSTCCVCLTSLLSPQTLGKKNHITFSTTPLFCLWCCSSLLVFTFCSKRLQMCSTSWL